MSQPTESPRHLLLVDDNAEGRRALDKILTLSGFRVEAAADGTSALAALRSPSRFQAVLIDLLLPDMDGRDVARVAATLTPRPLIILITGWGEEAEAEDLARSGVDFVHYKPLDVADLIARLRRLPPAG